MQHSTLKRAYFVISMYNRIVYDHLCDTRLPTFETISFFAYCLGDIHGLIKKYVVTIYTMAWKLCRTLKLPQMVAICFPFISYKFQYQPSLLRTVVSIRVNGVRDIRSVFHRVFFLCMKMTDFEQRSVIKFLLKRNKWIPSTTKQCCKKLRKQWKRREVQITIGFYTGQFSFALFSHCPPVPHMESSDCLTPFSQLSKLESTWLFLFFKRTIKGKWYQTTEEIRLVTERELYKITVGGMLATFEGDH